MPTISPYHKPGFYDEALAKGRHRDIVGGRWDETGSIQLALLKQAGLKPRHHLLDIGAGSLRLGCKAVSYLDPDHYWATDLSGALLRRGYQTEIPDKTRLSPTHLIEDADFRYLKCNPACGIGIVAQARRKPFAEIRIAQRCDRQIDGNPHRAIPFLPRTHEYFCYDKTIDLRINPSRFAMGINDAALIRLPSSLTARNSTSYCNKVRWLAHESTGCRCRIIFF